MTNEQIAEHAKQAGFKLISSNPGMVFRRKREKLIVNRGSLWAFYGYSGAREKSGLNHSSLAQFLNAQIPKPSGQPLS